MFEHGGHDVLGAVKLCRKHTRVHNGKDCLHTLVLYCDALWYVTSGGGIWGIKGAGNNILLFPLNVYL